MLTYGILNFLLAQSLVFGAVHNPLTNPLSDHFIRLINQKATTWKAGRNFDESTPLVDLRKLLGVLPRIINSRDVLTLKHNIADNFKFPMRFDSRQNWPYCLTIAEVRDQGSCGSCWAVASVEVMSDRTCIHSQGDMNFHYSTEDLLTCCPNCGSGCDGGIPERAFEYWEEVGIVSGGPYNSSVGCRPYTIPSDSQYHNTPACMKTCIKRYETPYKRDLHFGLGLYTVSKNEKEIKYELIQNGPVLAAISVYEDFYSYKSGVYQYEHGGYQGGHAVKIIGYGIEDGVPYWLCANSWNYSWGDQGFFKILRGANHCGIESRIVAGLPSL